jgi:CheY-like chemotaxis protein
VEVVCAEDGYKALEHVKAQPFDLVFLDVRMPGMNGLETYRAIQGIRPGTAVAMMTGFALDDVLDCAQREGVRTILRKPFDMESIKTLVDNIARDPGAGGGRRSVLLVDDDEGVRRCFAANLRSHGIRCVAARDRDEAFACLEKDQFEVAFIDILLGDSDGVKLCQDIKARWPQTAVLLITAYPKLAQMRAGASGADGAFMKPFDMPAVIQRVLGSQPAT